MERQVLDLFACDLGHASGPAAVAPGDQLNRRIGCAHRLCEFDGLTRRSFEVEALLVVRRFVADLPESNAERTDVAMSLPLGIAGVIAVGHPRGGFVGVGGSYAAFRLHVLLPPVRLEVDADQRFGADCPAQADELRGTHLVRLDSTPEQVQHRRPLVAWPDALPPSVEIRKDAAPPHHRRRQIARDRHHVVAPPIGEVVPGSFNRAVGRAERLHELHVEIRRQLEQRGGLDGQWGRTAALRRDLCRQLKAPGCRNAGGRYGGVLQKRPSSHRAASYSS